MYFTRNVWFRQNTKDPKEFSLFGSASSFHQLGIHFEFDACQRFRDGAPFFRDVNQFHEFCFVNIWHLRGGVKFDQRDRRTITQMDSRGGVNLFGRETGLLSVNHNWHIDPTNLSAIFAALTTRATPTATVRAVVPVPA
jgi:hypothetical protein